MPTFNGAGRTNFSPTRKVFPSPLQPESTSTTPHALSTMSKDPATALAPAVEHQAHDSGTDDWTVPDDVKRHPYFVEIHTSVADALKELDRKIRAGDRGFHLLSSKTPKPLFGRVIQAGRVGLWEVNGRPIISMRPGKYWNWSPRHIWRDTTDVTSPIDFLGLTAAQVGQAEAMVVQDPQNRVC
ncbi:hypothetical protein BDK51DRAFT_49113 [Blyttiomyces helicus]|uniref:Uncharacterized protein n=1 Tax=Blyttiomyces helicus TaxID=388810 RepID=A0A4P9W125_9FUNG|nr:hypothetical protein BDK51DRAFT_49113 [Blyttiomyces helicus]|eukprot:RKO84388.1 hypothetical protein BDK51DRAFT_49113 [Blyttiomyces helicus]